VIYFLESFLEHRDRAAFEVICYHVGAIEDGVSARLKGLCDGWRHIFPANGLLIREALAADAPDVVVELGGLTCPPALVALANHAVPVQVSYIGYPDTTGVAAIDARIVDEVTDPPGADRWAVEKLVRLPQCFLCYRPEVAAPAPRMPEGPGVTFGSFNNPAKISDRAVALWSRVLTEVPDSTLVLKGRGWRASRCGGGWRSGSSAQALNPVACDSGTRSRACTATWTPTARWMSRWTPCRTTGRPRRARRSGWGSPWWCWRARATRHGSGRAC
jgi:predicted O-linked N-acetylglucosamine transferase (SPINDLY family)